MEHYEYVIVGGGPASRLVNSYLHEFLGGVTTCLVRDEESILNHCVAPYLVDDTVPWKKGIIGEELVTKFGTPVIVDAVVGGDPHEKYVELRSGRRIGYGKLVLATGSDQLVPRVPGCDLAGVLRVKRTADMAATIESLADMRSVVVVGAGFIGVEFAVAMRNRGMDVTLVEMQPHVFGGMFEPAFMELVEARLTELGVRLVLGKAVTSIEGEDRVESVMLDDGSVLPADGLLFSVGVRPLVDYADAIGLKVGRAGIEVDDFFRTNLPDVFALGDSVAVRSVVTGLEVPGKLGSNAAMMARHFGLQRCGWMTPFRGVVNPVVTRIPGLSFGAAGATEAELRRAGIDYDSVAVDSMTEYSNMPEAKPVRLRLLFDVTDGRVLGGEFLGDFNPAGSVENLATHLAGGATLFDLAVSHFGSHPELTPKPSHPFLPLAAQAALKKHWKRLRPDHRVRSTSASARE